MNILRTLITPLLVTFAFSGASRAETAFDFQKIAPKVAENVSQLLERGHYSKRKLDNSLSQQLLKNYLERLDSLHLFFTQKDVDAFATKHATTLDNDLRSGNIQAALDIYAVYRRRVEDRVAKAKAQIAGKFDFTSSRVVELDRLKSPWPKDEADGDAIWRDRVEGEMLELKLKDDKAQAPAAALTRRYDQLLRSVQKQGSEDIISAFLGELAETYDPHSDYMSRSETERFNISMSLKLVGIGVGLVSEDGFIKVTELMAGGPAALDGRLKVGDRITAVAQSDGSFVETAELDFDKVADMIRGKENTTVRLRVLPATATDAAERKLIAIVRNQVKLTEQEARAEIIEHEMPDGTKQRIGWITLPLFYADFQQRGKEGAKSTTKDVRKLVERLKKENVTGLVMDLRRNGGGSLDEAVNLTGLFIKSGPVVQVQDGGGRVARLSDRDQGNVAYDGPMVVLTNKLSASASEIFAAALQDYNRAVIVGDSCTFGKGTVQIVEEMAGHLPSQIAGSSDAGSLKLTIQKFYRVSGGSTQLEGVRSDIRLPSRWDRATVGESALKAPLPYTTIDPAVFEKLDKDLFKDELKRRSTARVIADQEFQWSMEDIERANTRIAENRISLNEEKRRTERDEDKARREKRDEVRAKTKASEDKVYSITLANAAKPGLELKGVTDSKTVSPAEENDEIETLANTAQKVDPIRNETVNILRDLVDLARKVPPMNTAAVRPSA